MKTRDKQLPFDVSHTVIGRNGARVTTKMKLISVQCERYKRDGYTLLKPAGIYLIYDVTEVYTGAKT